jgi:hypothetical protein
VSDSGVSSGSFHGNVAFFLDEQDVELVFRELSRYCASYYAASDYEDIVGSHFSERII